MSARDLVLNDNEVALAGPEYDQPPSPLKRFIVIAATARTGSYMLARMLRELGYGIGLEYYHGGYCPDFARRWGVAQGPNFWPEFLDAVIRHRTTHGFCTAKCMPLQFPAFNAGLEARPDLAGLCYIHIWRRDVLAQAISLRLAYRSGIWNFTDEPTTPPDEALDVFDLDALNRSCQRLVWQEVAWRTHLRGCGAPVAHVAYEDLVADRECELRRLVAFIDPERVLPSPLPVDEPASGAALRARQHLPEAERDNLRRAYEQKFGAPDALPEP